MHDEPAENWSSVSGSKSTRSPLSGARLGDAIVAAARRGRFPWTPYLFLTPTLASLLLICLMPIALGVWLSFQSGEPADSAKPALGLMHYQYILGSSLFWNALWVSILFTVSSVAGTSGVGLATALLLNQRFPGHSLAGAALIVPWAMPLVVVAIVWGWLFDYQYGIVNYAVTQTGLTAAIGWLTDPAVAPFTVVITQVWKLFPLAMVMLLAGLKAIPEELFEAARVDGAGRWRSFLNITLPGLRPVTTALVLLLTIWSFGRAFTVIFVMTGGGPAHATETLVIQTYLEGFKFFHLERASALGTIVLVISAFFTLI